MPDDHPLRAYFLPPIPQDLPLPATIESARKLSNTDLARSLLQEAREAVARGEHGMGYLLHTAGERLERMTDR